MAKPRKTEAEIAKRTAETKAAAGRALAKTEKLNIRFTEEEILRIQAVAAKQKMRVMPMMREWVLKCLVEAERPTAGEYIASGLPVVASPVGTDRALLAPSMNIALQNLAEALVANGFLQRPALSVTTAAFENEGVNTAAHWSASSEKDKAPR